MNLREAVLIKLDRLDSYACRLGLVRPARWECLLSSRAPKIYAGQLSRTNPQWTSYFGVTPFASSSRNIQFDLCHPLPIPDGSIDAIQSEDVFEHIAFNVLPEILKEMFRILRPGGLLRISVPDYRWSVYVDRSLRSEAGEIIFDPGGGGRLLDGRVVDGGHLWFPTLELVQSLLSNSPFASQGAINYLHYNRLDGSGKLDQIDYRLGYIARTPDHDPRHRNSSQAISIVVDCWKS